MKAQVRSLAQGAHEDVAIFDRLAAGLHRADASAAVAAARRSPTRADEVAYVNGVAADGTLTDDSYWGDSGKTAFKWGDAVLGTGATITYAFDPTSRFSTQEKETFLKAFAMWSGVADVTFTKATVLNADVLLTRGSDGGAHTQTVTSNGSGSTPGRPIGQSVISIDTSVPGFDLSGSLDTYGGYGMSTIIHEVGHLLGLGHGGNYNGDVVPETDQQSAYDDRMYTIMSYIFWGTPGRYSDQNPYQGTNWGLTDDETPIRRQAPHSVMALDILAIQQLYGAAESTPFDGGQVYGFNSNIGGPLHDFYDFTVNTDPVLTLYNQGLGNTLDLSGYDMKQRVDLRAGTFSDIAGHVNNVAIADGTVIETAIGGSGRDTIHASAVASTLGGGDGADRLLGGRGGDALAGDEGDDVLRGGFGQDTLIGGLGADTFAFRAPHDSAHGASRADLIADFSQAEGDRIDLSAIDADAGVTGDQAFHFIGSDAFGHVAGELRMATLGGNTLVFGDVDGDARADFAVRLTGAVELVAADFVL